MTAPAVTAPPCQHGYTCRDHDRLPSTDGLHRDDCMLSAASRKLRHDRIDALTPAQARHAMHWLAGYRAGAMDEALMEATCGRLAILRPEDMPEGAL